MKVAFTSEEAKAEALEIWKDTLEITKQIVKSFKKDPGSIKAGLYKEVTGFLKNVPTVLKALESTEMREAAIQKQAEEDARIEAELDASFVPPQRVNFETAPIQVDEGD